MQVDGVNAQPNFDGPKGLAGNQKAMTMALNLIDPFASQRVEDNSASLSAFFFGDAAESSRESGQNAIGAGTALGLDLLAPSSSSTGRSQYRSAKQL